MAIEYQPYDLPYPLNTGERITIVGKIWDCVIPCTVIGHVHKGKTPVVRGPDGPILNDGHLIPPHTLRTRGKPGQTPTEVLTLGQYERVNVKHLVGKKIIAARRGCSGILIICEDLTYTKVCATEGYDGVELDSESLLLHDLETLGLVSAEVLENHTAEQKATQARHTYQEGARLIQRGLSMLPIDVAQAIIDEKKQVAKHQQDSGPV
ncbi:MAG: hypothetical protein ACYS7Y_11725 [Planctomycetota bacterium]|jgi:hypothetical protein